MVHCAGAVSHQSEIRHGSGEAPDWIVQHGEQTYVLGGGLERGRKEGNKGKLEGSEKKRGSEAEIYRGREEERET